MNGLIISSWTFCAALGYACYEMHGAAIGLCVITGATMIVQVYEM